MKTSVTQTCLVVSGDNRGTIKRWSVASGKNTATHHPAGILHCMVFSPNGKILALGSDDRIILWKIAHDKTTIEFKGHAHFVDSLAFSPDGKTLASAGADFTIKLWDISDD